MSRATSRITPHVEVPLELYDNADCEFTLAFVERDDDGNVIGPADVSGWTFAAQIRRTALTTGEPLLEFTISRPADDLVTFTIDKTLIAAARAVVEFGEWDMVVVDEDGHDARPYGGPVILKAGVTR